jgi:hypothetical protein
MSSHCSLFKSFVKSTIQMYKNWLLRSRNIRIGLIRSNPEIQVVEIKQEGPKFKF